MSDKNYFSLLDITRVDTIPQSLQHQIIKGFVASLNGSISFYTTESPYSSQDLQVFYSKLREKPVLDGFILLTIQQLFSKTKFHYDFIVEAIDSGYELHFAVDKVSICNEKDLKEKGPLIWAYYQDRIENNDKKLSRNLLDFF